MTVLVRHDEGCKWSRFDGTVDDKASILSGSVRPGHSDEAKRFSDAFNLAKAAGETSGWLAVRLSDGGTDGTVYETRAAAVAHQGHQARWRFYCHLGAAGMSVCAAESLLRWKRVMNEVEDPDSGMEVIPRLAAEDQEAQIRAVRSGQGMLAMGRRR